jgi:hypothetical protein
MPESGSLRKDRHVRPCGDVCAMILWHTTGSSLRETRLTAATNNASVQDVMEETNGAMSRTARRRLVPSRGTNSRQSVSSRGHRHSFARLHWIRYTALVSLLERLSTLNWGHLNQMGQRSRNSDWLRAGVRVPVGSRIFTFPSRPDFETWPISYPMGTGDSFLGG